MLPSAAKSGAVSFIAPPSTPWPSSSPKTRTGPRTGTPMPTPHNRPWGTSIPDGSPRRTTSAFAAISAPPRFLLTIRPTAPAGAPAVVPASSSPVGNLPQPRTATANGAWVRSVIRFTFAPTTTSPMALPLKGLEANGKSGSTPPTGGLCGRNSGRTSRSMRVRKGTEPKTSTRSPTPKAIVPAIDWIAVNPCCRLKVAIWPLPATWPPATISAVGTNHNPVSPRKVTPAGRVPSS